LQTKQPQGQVVPQINQHPVLAIEGSKGNFVYSLFDLEFTFYMYFPISLYFLNFN